VSCGPDIISRLAARVDKIRGAVHTRMGTRPYTVWSVITKWSGGRRGRGTEYLIGESQLLPTPRITGGDGKDAQIYGIIEAGAGMISEVSWLYEEADFNPTVGRDEQAYIEIRATRDSTKRRFTIASDPELHADSVGWRFQIKAQQQSEPEVVVPP